MKHEVSDSGLDYQIQISGICICRLIAKRVVIILLLCEGLIYSSKTNHIYKH